MPLKYPTRFETKPPLGRSPGLRAAAGAKLPEPVVLLLELKRAPYCEKRWLGVGCFRGLLVAVAVAAAIASAFSFTYEGVAMSMGDGGPLALASTVGAVAVTVGTVAVAGLFVGKEAFLRDTGLLQFSLKDDDVGIALLRGKK